MELPFPPTTISLFFIINYDTCYLPAMFSATITIAVMNNSKVRVRGMLFAAEESVHRSPLCEGRLGRKSEWLYSALHANVDVS